MKTKTGRHFWCPVFIYLNLKLPESYIQSCKQKQSNYN